MTEYIYIIVDPRGHDSGLYYPTAQAAREDCAAKNAMLREKWGVVGVYWHVRSLTPASAARVKSAGNG